jgi:hypothetical protein
MASDSAFELVMPFVVCTSQGGPYDDLPFAAGYELGRIDATLAGNNDWRGTVRRESLPQLELIAMNHGRVIKNEDDDGNAWLLVRVTRGERHG